MSDKGNAGVPAVPRPPLQLLPGGAEESLPVDRIFYSVPCGPNAELPRCPDFPDTLFEIWSIFPAPADVVVSEGAEA